MAQACKAIEVAEQTYYRWRKGYGGGVAAGHPVEELDPAGGMGDGEEVLDREVVGVVLEDEIAGLTWAGRARTAGDERVGLGVAQALALGQQGKEEVAERERVGEMKYVPSKAASNFC